MILCYAPEFEVRPSAHHLQSKGTNVLDEREFRWRGYLEQIGKGHAESLGQLYRETVSILNGMALRLLGNPADAEEVVLEVYEQVWRSAAGYDSSRSRVLWWLSMLTRSRALDRLRTSRRRSAVEEPALDTLDFPDSGELPEDSMLATERIHLVRAALADLSPEQRQAVELAFFSELSHSEIAEKLDIPLGTIKTRIRTALRRLRDVLGDTGDVMEQTA
jgi:RNA polymerase sigma-70 factor (ECF subfamily)